MPDELSTGDESGSATGGSTAPAVGSDQSSGQAAIDNSTDESTDDATLEGDNDVDVDAVVADEIGKVQEGDKPEGDKPDDAAPEVDAQASKKESKSVVAQREHITNLEKQLAPLNELSEKVIEMGGLPTLELAQPLIEAALNPEAKASDILGALAQIAPHHSPEELAWNIVEENQAAVVADFFGDEITPELLTKLVDSYKAGDITLDDDVFGVDDNKGKTAGRDAGTKTAEQSAKAAELNTQRTTASQNVAKTYEEAVSTVLAPFAEAQDDTEDIKALKSFVRTSVEAQIAFKLSQDPTFSRVNQLLQKNAFKPAETLATGSVAIRIRRMAEELVKQANPFVAATIGQAQKQAKKIKEVREEPSGASTQADVIPQRAEITTKTPNWRQELDAQLKADLNALAEKAQKQGRDHEGKFLGK